MRGDDRPSFDSSSESPQRAGSVYGHPTSPGQAHFRLRAVTLTLVILLSVLAWATIIYAAEKLLETLAH